MKVFTDDVSKPQKGDEYAVARESIKILRGLVADHSESRRELGEKKTDRKKK